jgi:phospholipid/cholesterol/gamma-HCH transport system substrate-binding protein
MEEHTSKFKIRLGLFILGGLLIFVAAIFIIGKQKNLFNPVFKLTTTFYNVGGLQVGNNIRFSGINVGTVDNIDIINDSTVRIEMIIRKEIQKFIKTDCEAGIGSSGLIGDKLLTISQGKNNFPSVTDGQSIASNEPVETDAILSSLKVTAGNAEIISYQMASMLMKINNGKGTLGRLIQDTAIAENLNQTIINMKKGTKGLDENMEAAKHNFLFKNYYKKKAAQELKNNEAKRK